VIHVLDAVLSVFDIFTSASTHVTHLPLIFQRKIIMKKIIGLIALLVSLSNVFADIHSKYADEIVGLYWSPKKDAKIEIFKRNNRYYGRSVWVAFMRKDLKNPDETQKNRQVLGIELLIGFSFTGDSYTDGKIYDPESGKTYDCKMTLTDKILKVRGFIGVSLFGRTEIFEKIR
jgi:uncharacterized protein (DUF2147 family)